MHPTSEAHTGSGNGVKVFISYAHSSPERSATVAKLVRVLRAQGLSVAVDVDVDPVIGPEEGWPRWMYRQIEEARWVLMWFDVVYLRRFLGQEAASGANWEGLIITKAIYDAGGRNRKFIPLLDTGESSNLIPWFLSGTWHNIPAQSFQLAERLASSEPELHVIRTPSELQRRDHALWRFAYTFLRLDQLPSGGWGKSLPGWMEAIWKGDAGTITRPAEMRTLGGTDFTCGAFSNYVQCIERFPGHGGVHAVAPDDLVASGLSSNLRNRVDHGGSVTAVGVQGRRVPGRVNLRHTAMAMIGFLHCGRSTGFGVFNGKELKLTASYLLEHFSRWESDTSYPFGMLAALIKLKEMLQNAHYKAELSDAGVTVEPLNEALDKHLPPILCATLDAHEYLTSPPKTCPDAELPASTFFVPYGRFWRMERAVS